MVFKPENLMTSFIRGLMIVIIMLRQDLNDIKFKLDIKELSLFLETKIQ